MADRNVRIIRRNGHEPIVKRYGHTASQAFDKNSLVEFASGLINPTDANDLTVFGVIKEEVLAANTANVLVELILPGDEVEIDSTAALTVGTSYGIDNAYQVDQTDTTNKVFTCTAAPTSTRAQGFMKAYTGSNNL